MGHAEVGHARSSSRPWLTARTVALLGLTDVRRGSKQRSFPKHRTQVFGLAADCATPATPPKGLTLLLGLNDLSHTFHADGPQTELCRACKIIYPREPNTACSK